MTQHVGEPFTAHDLLFSRANYSAYPAFAQRRAQIEEAYREEINQVHASVKTMGERCMATNEPLPDMEMCLDRPCNEIKARYAALIWQAHQDYHVPVLLDWPQAITKTGAARYHETAEEGMSRQATIWQQEDGNMCIETHERITVPVEKVEHHLIWRLFCGPLWEACPKEACSSKEHS